MNKFLSLLLIFGIALNLQAQSKEEYTQEILKHRDHYKMDFLKDTNSPLEAGDLENIAFYGINKDLCLKCSYEILEKPTMIKMPTYSGKEKIFQKYAKLSCPLYDGTIYFYGYKNTRTMNMPGFKDQLFVPFKDNTNGDSTYGGGRYVDIDMKNDNINGKIILDLNKAYNPWCCYSDGYNCPIPPSENNQTITIRAGEKMYKGEHKVRKK